MRLDGGGLPPKRFYRNRRLPVTRRFAHLGDGPTGGDIPVICRRSCPDCGAFLRGGKLFAWSLSRVTRPGYFGRAPPLQSKSANYPAFYSAPFHQVPACISAK